MNLVRNRQLQLLEEQLPARPAPMVHLGAAWDFLSAPVNTNTVAAPPTTSSTTATPATGSTTAAKPTPFTTPAGAWAGLESFPNTTPDVMRDWSWRTPSVQSNTESMIGQTFEDGGIAYQYTGVDASGNLQVAAIGPTASSAVDSATTATTAATSTTAAQVTNFLTEDSLGFGYQNWEYMGAGLLLYLLLAKKR